MFSILKNNKHFEVTDKFNFRSGKSEYNFMKSTFEEVRITASYVSQTQNYIR